MNIADEQKKTINSSWLNKVCESWHKHLCSFNEAKSDYSKQFHPTWLYLLIRSLQKYDRHADRLEHAQRNQSALLEQI